MLRQFIIVILMSIACVFGELLNLNEGSKCTWKGAKGVCVIIHKCESAPTNLKNRDYPPICTFEGKVPIICCTDCHLVEDSRRIIYNPQIGNLTSSTHKSNLKCMQFIDKLDYECKIGKTTEYLYWLDTKAECYQLETNSLTPTDWEEEEPAPKDNYLAFLGYGDAMNTAQWSCAGAIISEKFILTAAHCLNYDDLGPVKYVAVGITKWNDPSENWQRYKVKRRIPHPAFKPPSLYHDIGLLETETTIQFSKDVLPACLKVHPDTYVLGELLTHSLISDDGGGFLKRVSLMLFDSIQCSFFYPPQDRLVDGFNETTQICYGEEEEPKDTCQSHSGSPLVSVFLTAKCATMIMGVSSLDRSCGTGGSSGLFTLVDYYLPWIESVAWP